MAANERSVMLKLGSKLGPQGKKGFQQMRGGVRNVAKYASKALNFGAMLAGGVAALGVAGLIKGVQDARQFGMAMAEVSTLVNTSKVNMAGLSKEVLELSRATGKGPEDLAKALYQAISAGIPAAEAMEFLEKSTKAAIGGVASVTEAVDLSTSVLNAYGMEAKEANRINDIVFATIKAGKTTYPELASSMGQVLPFASQLNVSLVDLFAAMASLTKGGIDTASAATFLKGALTAALKPSSDAAKTSKKLGLNFSAAALRAQGLAGFLEQVKIAAEGNDEAMAKLFPNVRGLTAALALTGKQAGDFAKIQKELANSAGESGKAFRKIAESDAYQYQIAMNDLKITGIELGQKALPGITRALKALSPYLKIAADFTGDLVEGFAAILESEEPLWKKLLPGLKYVSPAAMMIPDSVWKDLERPDTSMSWKHSRDELARGRYAEYGARFDRRDAGKSTAEDRKIAGETSAEESAENQGQEIGARLHQATQRGADKVKRGIEKELRRRNVQQAGIAPA